MKYFTLLLLNASLAFCGWSQSGDEKRSLPPTSLKNMEGENVALSSYGENGKLTLITFWATWCSPCKKELNNMADLYAYWKDDFDLEILAISIDDPRNTPKVKSFVSGQAWEFIVLIDSNQELKRSLNFQTIPFTIIVDRAGKVVYRHQGYVEGDEYVFEEKFQALSRN